MGRELVPHAADHMSVLEPHIVSWAWLGVILSTDIGVTLNKAGYGHPEIDVIGLGVIVITRLSDSQIICIEFNFCDNQVKLLGIYVYYEGWYYKNKWRSQLSKLCKGFSTLYLDKEWQLLILSKNWHEKFLLKNNN